jgi:hypothetical protein
MLALALPASALAAAPVGDGGAWETDANNVRASAAGISVPQQAGTLSLVKSGEISNSGEGLDNYAQFASEDGVVQGTAYIYMPSYADAAVSAYMTDKAIHERFGPQTKRIAYGLAPAGGHAGVAIRSVYSGADGELITAAALVHAGRWLVKLRVTGTADRAAEVKAGLDAMLAKLQFDKTSLPVTATADRIGACPVADGPGAAVMDVPTSASDATAVAEGKAEPASSFSFPRDGRDGMCVRGTARVGADTYDILQTASGADGAAPVLIPLDDAGRVMRFDRITGSSGYRLTVHQVGRTDVYNVYDRIPTSSQIAAIIDGSDAKGTTLLLSTAMDADGRMTVSNEPRNTRP